MHHVMIPPAFIALNQEIPHHPLLFQRIQKHPGGQPEIVMAEIAAYCGIAVDGIFVESELAILADKCLEVLQRQRPKSAIRLEEEKWDKVFQQELDKQRNGNKS